MKLFNEICELVENMDADSYSEVLVEKSLTILPALADILEDDLKAVSVFATFILGAIAADGKLDENEYKLLYPFLREFFGDSIDYESCKNAASAFKKEGKELKKYVNYMVDIIGNLSDDLKEDIIIVCILICSIDGKISVSEKMWIKQLLK